MRLYFVRHGESEANTLGVFSNRSAPHALTPRGRQQVEALALTLRDVRFGAFYSSPIPRAVESAEILSARLGVPYRTTPALAEYDVGVLEGKSDAESWRRYDRVREAWLRGDAEERIEGGESLTEIRSRFAPLMEQLRTETGSSPTLLLGHGGLFACALPRLFPNLDPSLPHARGLGHTEYAVGELMRAGAVCLRWGGTVLTDDQAQ